MTEMIEGGRPAFDIAEFGVVGDGIADDGPAIEAALVASAGGTLLFPRGTYLAEPLHVPAGTSLRGDAVLNRGADIQHVDRSAVPALNEELGRVGADAGHE